MDPDQTARMHRLVCIHAGHKPIMLVLPWRDTKKKRKKERNKERIKKERRKKERKQTNVLINRYPSYLNKMPLKQTNMLTDSGFPLLYL
jgi:hypothetical protein